MRKIKRVLAIVLSAMMFQSMAVTSVSAVNIDTVSVGAVSAYSESETSAVKITLDKTSIYTYEGGTEKLTATVVPVDADTGVIWSSTNTNVATVDSNGNVTAVSKGTAKITARTNNGLTASCNVNVSVLPQEVFLDKTSLTMVLNDTYQLTPSVSPEDAYASYEWWTSNANIVSVDDQGNLRARSIGTATIAVTTSNGISTLCTVNVIAVPIRITLDKTDFNMHIGDEVTLRKTVVPSNAVSEYKWSSSNTAVATVDQNGKITAKALGDTSITVKSDNEISASCIVHVKKQPESIRFAESEKQMAVGVPEVFEVIPTPEDAYADCTFSSSNANIAVIDANGRVTPRAVGNCVITAVTGNGKTATCNLTVSAQPSSIRINESNSGVAITLQIGKSKQLTTTILPANAYTTCTWESSNTDVVKVDENGKITGVSVGTSEVTVKTSNGKQDKRVIICGEVPTGISISKSEITMNLEEQTEVYAILESDYAVADLIWTYEINGTISASVNARTGNLVIKSARAGRSVITVTTDNGLTANCVVNVVPSVKSIVILNSPQPIKMNPGDKASIIKRVTPASIQTVYTWTSSNEDVATVDANGLVSAVNVGKAIITVTAENGVKASCEVDVCPLPDSITLDKSSLSLKNNEYYTFEKTLYPENSYSPTYTWKSSDTNVATVDAYGKIMGRDTGTAVITVTTKNGKTASCTVNVVAEPLAVMFNENSTYWLREGETGKLTTRLSPAGALTTFTWSSSDTSIATVDADGTIHAIKQGTVTITVETANGKKASLKITIYKKPTKVVLAQNSLSMYVTQKFTFQPDVYPENSKTSGYTYSSSKPEIAEIDDKGNVVAKSIGTTIITVKDDLNHSAKCIITVYPVPETVTLNASIVNLNKGKTYTLVPTITPDNALTAYTWTSSDSSIATVDENGKVKAVDIGTAYITVSTSNDKTATCKINVKRTPTNVELNKTSMTLGEGQTYTLTTILTPASAYTTYKWSSSNTTVASVNSSGKVGARAVGTATITVTTANGKTATCKVTVKKGPTSIKPAQTEINLGAGQTYDMTYTLSPSNAVTVCTWSSSKTSVAKVSSSGRITAKSSGTATITLKTSNGKTATCKVTVAPAPTSIQLSKTTYEMGVGQSYTFSTVMKPSNAFVSNTWSSSNSNVVSVNSLGKISARCEGTATITVKTYNDVTASCVVTVKTAPESVAINKTAVNVGVGQSVTLKSTLTPENAYTFCNWSSSDTSIAKVSSQGVVTGEKVGTATITVKTSNGKTAICKVNVKSAPTSVTLTPSTAKLSVGGTVTLTKTLTPSNSATSFKWTSSNTGVATVDSTGKVKAVAKGTATITVATFNGKKATCKITVA